MATESEIAPASRPGPIRMRLFRGNSAGMVPERTVPTSRTMTNEEAVVSTARGLNPSIGCGMGHPLDTVVW
jgi:hypothetical protein